jgi:hypothetical protein
LTAAMGNHAPRLSNCSASRRPHWSGKPLRLGAPSVWLSSQCGRAYFARRSTAASSELGVYAVDLTDPAAPLPAGNAFLPAADGRAALDVIPTQGAMIVARGELGAYDNEPRQAGERLTPGRRLSFDVVDLSAPGAPRVGGSVDLPEAVASGGFGDWPTDVTIDTAWGWQNGFGSAPLLVSGELLTSDHAEAIDVRHRRFFVDRVDVSRPDAPAVLSPINIPGQSIAFDAATGSLDDSRRSVAFAVSGERAYYITEPLLDHGELQRATSSPRETGRNAGMPFTLERVRIDHGQLERLPSIDLTGLHDALPREWRIYARGERLFTLSESELGIIDTSVEPPSVRKMTLPPYVCVAFEVVGNTAYCSRGAAGVIGIALTIDS